MYEQSHRDYLALVICIIVCLSQAVNHYRVPRHYLQSPARQKCQRTEAGERGNYDMQMRQRDVAALDAKYTKELADAKAENDALRDDNAAGRRRLHVEAVTVRSVREVPPPPAWIMQPPRLADTAERDYFTLRERLQSLQKQLEGTQVY